MPPTPLTGPGAIRRPVERRLVLRSPLDLRATLGTLVVAPGDPCLALHATDAAIGATTPDGPGAVHLRLVATEVAAVAHGPGAGWLLEHLPELLGEHDRPEDYRPRHPFLVAAARRRPGLRVPRARRVVDVAAPTILAQKVTGPEARRAWRGLVRRYGQPAPGGLPVAVPPSAAVLAELPYPSYHRVGVERRRAEVVRRVAALGPRLEAAVDRPDHLLRLLAAQTGVGPWTLGHLGLAVLGDPDAVPVGDYHLPNLVAWNLAGEPRADDTRMLELLAPEAGHRGRAVRLLALAGARAPAYGPRSRPRDITGL